MDDLGRREITLLGERNNVRRIVTGEGVVALPQEEGRIERMASQVAWTSCDC